MILFDYNKFLNYSVSSVFQYRKILTGWAINTYGNNTFLKKIAIRIPWCRFVL